MNQRHNVKMHSDTYSLLELKPKICVIGLGYVGLPLALEFSKRFCTKGYDIESKRILELKKGFDRTGEISEEKILACATIQFTSDSNDIAQSNIYIITVPTPVDKNKKPDLSSIIEASRLVGKSLSKDDIVIYESTVFPGCTEEVCVPILEKFSSMKYNVDFYCGYSPERINPGDKKHTLTKIKKIVSGSNKSAALYIKQIYDEIILAGTYVVSSIRVAEAAKIIENTQRDVNIALINELAIIFNKLNLDTKEILDAAKTKWNFLSFSPGLVGGHCIGVDPYYLTHKAIEIGYNPEVILAGRKINDSIGDYIVEETIKCLVKQNIKPKGANISILGLTFKENCSDIRNTQVRKMISKFSNYNCNVSISDYWVNDHEIEKKFQIKPLNLQEVTGQDAIVIAVGHHKFSKLKVEDFDSMLVENGVLIDVKSLFSKTYFKGTNYLYWRL